MHDLTSNYRCSCHKKKIQIHSLLLESVALLADMDTKSRRAKYNRVYYQKKVSRQLEKEHALKVAERFGRGKEMLLVQDPRLDATTSSYVSGVKDKDQQPDHTQGCYRQKKAERWQENHSGATLTKKEKTCCLTESTSRKLVAPFPAVSLAPENSNFNDRERSRDDTIVMIHGRKVAPFPAVSLAPENNNFNDRERSRDDTVVMIHGRKVRMSEGRSGSLYALCRSWVRNGSHQESQPNIGDSLRFLPKPLPASAVNSQLLKQSEETNEADDSGKEEDTISSEQLSADDLLKGHIKRAKKVRARFRKERLLRIERYKQRLTLILPTHIELLGRNDATPKR